MLATRMVPVAVLIACGAVVGAQQSTTRPLSPQGSAQAQVLGRWVKGGRPSFAVGQERYMDGKWVEITYGRPLLRGRDVFGSGANYGKALVDLPLGEWGAPPVWRAGANVSTRLNTEATLILGDKQIPAGEVQPVHRCSRPRRLDVHRLKLGGAAADGHEGQDGAVGLVRLHTGQRCRTGADEDRDVAVQRRTAHVGIL